MTREQKKYCRQRVKSWITAAGITGVIFWIVNVVSGIFWLFYWIGLQFQ